VILESWTTGEGVVNGIRGEERGVLAAMKAKRKRTAHVDKKPACIMN
jgi:hypothetical protein